MTRWIKNRLTRIFHPATHRAAPSNRFRPSMISLEDRTVPAGADMFANATVLTGTFDSDFTDAATHAASTGETDGPFNESSLIHANGDINSLWWSWTAPASGQYAVNTFGTAIDTVLAVYTGSSLSTLNMEAENDDFDLGGGILQSQAVFTATAGTTYHIAVDGFGSETGEIFLNLGGIPANDDFANATVVSGGTVTGSSVQATGEVGEPTHGYSAPGINGTNDLPPSPEPLNSVWWSWTPSTTGNATITTAGSSLDTILAVYTGGAVNALQFVAADDDVDLQGGDLSSSVTFLATSGVTYHIAVEGNLHHTGTIQLNIPGGAVNNPPVVDDQSFWIDENEPNGTVVGTVVATDPDVGDELTYAITGGNTNGAFAIDPDSGVITVANAAALNFEATNTFNLTVHVNDDAASPGFDDAIITINLNDLNETPSVGPAGPFGLAENSANGTAVGSVPSFDPDAGDVLTYVITAGNTNGAFAINSSGQITVANSAALDFETTAVFNLTVQVTDSGNLSATTSVTINLADVFEAAPEFLELNNMVVALHNGGFLNNSQANKLLKDLDNAERQYNRGNIAQAESQLQMFINKVLGHINSGVLTSGQGQPLIDQAQFIIDNI